MTIVQQGSVRIDLLGGTLDLRPINLILPNVITLNLATSLKAKVEIMDSALDGVRFKSLDYNVVAEFKAKDFNEINMANEHFGQFKFFAQILDLFNLNTHLDIVLESGSPPGAGLGGSSAMGITFYKALCEKNNISLDCQKAIFEVNDIEARLLNCGPAGYQDYYPALYGGILALKAKVGKVEVEQLYSQELKHFIEEHVTLIDSCENRFSGFNNWEVYKAFFDRKNGVREGMAHIAKLSFEAYQSLKSHKFVPFLTLMKEEGKAREKLFPNIVIPKVKEFFGVLKKDIPEVGMKVCGAGGGGCFIILHDPTHLSQVEKMIANFGMRKLPFSIERPLHG